MCLSAAKTDFGERVVPLPEKAPLFRPSREGRVIVQMNTPYTTRITSPESSSMRSASGPKRTQT